MANDKNGDNLFWGSGQRAGRKSKLKWAWVIRVVTLYEPPPEFAYFICHGLTYSPGLGRVSSLLPIDFLHMLMFISIFLFY